MPSRLDILRRGAPQALLRRLTPAAKSREHDLTVMFTDIVGFTRLAESLGHAAVAELLDHHLAALAARIERERGVVHKVLGDGLLAFWDAAGAGVSPAAPAVRAALAIRDAVEADNTARAARGLAGSACGSACTPARSSWRRWGRRGGSAPRRSATR